MSDDKDTIENIVHLTTPEFMYLLQRVDRIDEKFTSKIEALDEKFTSKIEALDEKFTSKIEALDEKFTSKIEALDGKFTSRIEALDEKLTNNIDGLRIEFKQEFNTIRQDNSSIRTLIWATLGLMVGTIAVALTAAISLMK